jgi:membrane protein CcdC involved in cytochrome C biogenesis
MKRKPNIKIIIFSLIALGCLALTFFVDWLFIIPAAILMYLNQKELMKNRKK